MKNYPAAMIVSSLIRESDARSIDTDGDKWKNIIFNQEIDSSYFHVQDTFLRIFRIMYSDEHNYFSMLVIPAFILI